MRVSLNFNRIIMLNFGDLLLGRLIKAASVFNLWKATHVLLLEYHIPTESAASMGRRTFRPL